MANPIELLTSRMSYRYEVFQAQGAQETFGSYLQHVPSILAIGSGMKLENFVGRIDAIQQGRHAQVLRMSKLCA